MRITYTPQGENGQVFDFDPERVRVAEAEMIEKRFGGTFQEWRAGITQGNAKARRVLLWHLMRKTHHTLRYEDTPDFEFGELKCEHDRGELVQMRDRLAKSNHPRRDELVSALDVEIDEAPAPEVDDEGKATSDGAE